VVRAYGARSELDYMVHKGLWTPSVMHMSIFFVFKLPPRGTTAVNNVKGV
jgi:hypothetical protein